MSLKTLVSSVIADVKKIAGVAPQFDDTDKLAVSIYGQDSAAGDAPPQCSASALDAVSAGLKGLFTHARNYLHNGASWDRQRNNEEATILASAARTAEASSADQVNYNHRGLIVVVDITVDPAGAAITPTLEIKDPVSGDYFTVWTAATALEAVGMTAYLFEIGALVGAAGSFTEAANIRMTRTWRFTMTVADANSMTYSVSANELV